MNNIEDLKNHIDIPEEIDFAIEKGIKRGKEEKARKKNKFNYKKVAAVAGITVAVTSFIGFANPEFVQAIPSIGSIFKQFKNGNNGEPIDKFEKYSKNINEAVESSGIKIKVQQVVIDDNSLAITTLLEGKDLEVNKGIMSQIKLNNQEVHSFRDSQKKLDDGSIMVIIYANISDLKIDKDIDFKWDVICIGDKKGEWNFNFKVEKSKETNSKVININKKIKVRNSTLEVENLVVSPLGNSINIKGVYDKEKEDEDLNLDLYDYLLLDDKGNPLISNFEGARGSNREYEEKISILNDIKDLKGITIIPLFKPWETKTKEINNISYDILQCTINSNDFKNTPQEIIQKTRPVTDKEKKDGYAYNQVIHLYNIDKSKKFKPLNEIINQEIVLGDNSKAIIKGIDVTDKETKLTFKLEGYYKYTFVDSVVLLDEEFNDVERGEAGECAILEDAKNNIVSIKLPPVDKDKKYKLALPVVNEPVIDEKYKINIDLK